MASRSLRMLRSRTRYFSFIAELASLAHRPGDRSDPRAKVDIPLQGVFQHPPEGGLHLDVLAVDGHVDIRVRTKTSSLQDRAEEVHGLDRRKERGQASDRLSRPLQDLQTKRLPLLPDLTIPAGVVLAIGKEGGFVH